MSFALLRRNEVLDAVWMCGKKSQGCLAGQQGGAGGGVCGTGGSLRAVLKAQEVKL